MKGDIPAPAFRLACALPVRTHTQERGPERGENMKREHWNTGRKAKRGLLPTFVKARLNKGIT